MKQWILFLSTIVALMFSISGYSSAVLSIVPSSTTSIVLLPDGTAVVTETVTNDRSITFHNLTVKPGFDINPSVAIVTASSDTCTGATLAPGASCTFAANMTAENQAGNKKLMPRVCVENGLFCVVPPALDRVPLIVESVQSVQSIAITPTSSTTLRRLATRQFTATATYSDGLTNNATTNVNWNSSNTSAATIGLNTGATTGVSTGTANITASLNGVTSNTVSLTFKDFAYVVNFLNSTLSACPVNSDGTFGACTAVTNAGAGNSTFSDPQGIALNPANTRLYVADTASSKVSSCPLNTDGSVGTCSAITSSTFSIPISIVFTPDGRFAYVGNYDNSATSLSLCDVNSDGSFVTPCVRLTGGGLPASGFFSISVNPAGTFAYLVDVNSGSYANSCAINASTGVLSGCVVNGTPPSLMSFAIHPSGLFGYGNNGFDLIRPINKCNVNTSTGLLSSCANQTLSGGVSYGPSYIAFNPVDTTKLYKTDTDNIGIHDQVILATLSLTTGDISGYQFLTDPTFYNVSGIAVE